MIAKRPVVPTRPKTKTPDEGSPVVESSLLDQPFIAPGTEDPITATDAELSGGIHFHPEPITTIKESGLSETLIESLVFKTLLAVGHKTGRGMASSLGLPPKPIIGMLSQLKGRQFVQYKDSTAMGDFEYALTDSGRMRARSYVEECSYVGKAPVTLEHYIESVTAQTITAVQPQLEDLQRAFSDLLVNERMLVRLGPAINSGRGLFLYGFPGNGKTSIAERITACFGDCIWVPHAIHASGEIITLYDPQNHICVDSGSSDTGATPSVDARWVQIQRPTIVVGGELTMDSLELNHNPQTKITEPSLQLKSNTGTLVIDDFGRQRMSTIELLNRWIVPLEKRYDYLTLASGKKIQVPFDQLIIFSTNLEPRELVDEAFLRRIPYKIEVVDPTDDEFRELCEIMAPIVGVELPPDAIDYLIETHYKSQNRPFRCCQPRDLLSQIKNASAFSGCEPVATHEALDAAVENYFAVM